MGADSVREISATDICNEVTISLQTARLTLRSSLKTSHVIDAFWRLQDLFHLLSALAGDKPSGFIPVLTSSYPSLIRDTIDLLSYLSQLTYSNVTAIEKSCNAINSYLIDLEQIKQQHRARVAGLTIA